VFGRGSFVLQSRCQTGTSGGATARLRSKHARKNLLRVPGASQFTQARSSSRIHKHALFSAHGARFSHWLQPQPPESLLPLQEEAWCDVGAVGLISAAWFGSSRIWAKLVTGIRTAQTKREFKNTHTHATHTLHARAASVAAMSSAGHTRLPKKASLGMPSYSAVAPPAEDAAAAASPSSS
jgi:hypothetical protein